GRFTAPDQQAADASEWLEAPAEDTGGDLKEKNLELLGQVMLLKKMLGEIDAEVVLLGPVGSYPISRGRLIWDTAGMEGFIHAVQLKPAAGKWFVQGYDEGRPLGLWEVPAPDREGLLQESFRPQGRLLSWDEFRLIREDEQGEQEVVLVGKRSF
ncbi:MAG: hypothetical protein AAF649_06475, partial [Verrucomicrobiota bacterium]